MPSLTTTYKSGVLLDLIACIFFLTFNFCISSTSNAETNDNDLLKLVEDGEYITLCGLPEAGFYLMESASLQSADFKDNPEIIYKVRCKYAAQLLQHGKAAQAKNVLYSLVPPDPESANQSVLQRLMSDASKKYDVQQAILIACGHLALVENRPADALDIALRSASLARSVKNMEDEAEALYIQAMAYRQLKRVELVTEKAQEAIARFRIAGSPLKEVQLRELLSRVYAGAGNFRLARIESEKALHVIPDESLAPLIDLKTNIENLERLRLEHHELANHGLYKTARNQIITLLIINNNKNNITDPALQKAVKNAKLYEGTLLAYLASYSVAIDHRSTAESLLPTIAAFENLRSGSRIRAEYAWAFAGLLFDLGLYKESEKQLQIAESLLNQSENYPAFLKIGAYETRALLEFQKGNKSQGKKTLNEAISLSRSLEMNDHKVYLESLLKSLLSNEGDMSENIPFYYNAQSISKQKTRKAESVSKDIAPIYQSAFADAYEDAVSAGDIIAKEVLKRPAPPRVTVKLSARDRMQMGQYDRAATMLEKEIAENGADVNRLMMLGSCYYQLHNWEKAFKTYQQVIDLEPDNAAASKRLKLIESLME